MIDWMFVLLVAGIILGVILLLTLSSGVRFISNNRIGIVEKRFSGKGSVKKGFIALNGEAGYQPHVLRGGLHYLMPVQYMVHVMPLVTIAQGKIGYLFARDGKQLDPGYVTVFVNGVLVQDHAQLEGPTGHKTRTVPGPSPEKGPLRLQDHGNPVRFRNIWIREL